MDFTIENFKKGLFAIDNRNREDKEFLVDFLKSIDKGVQWAADSNYYAFNPNTMQISSFQKISGIPFVTIDRITTKQIPEEIKEPWIIEDKDEYIPSKLSPQTIHDLITLCNEFAEANNMKVTITFESK